LVNLICDRALLGAYTRNHGAVSRSIARQAAREVLFESAPRFWGARRIAGLTALLLLTGLVIGLAYARFGWPPDFALDRHEPPPRLQIPPSDAAPAMATPQVSVPIPAGLPSIWPAEFAVGRSSAEALADLAALWGVVMPSGNRDACDFFATAGLRCLSRQDSLVSLRNFNRPAVLTLYDDSGKPFHILLAALDGQRARFVAGQETRELHVDVLESRWFGEFLLLWRPPAYYAAAASPGDSGPVVLWLARTLETLGLYVPTGSEARLDGHLLGALKRYQLSAGLAPDGMLGPQTLIHLHNALGLKEPLLKPVETSN
jgi:general secretion pathway protein A